MLSDALKRFAGLLWFLPGFILWAAYPPMGETSDCLFALAPLLWLSRRDVPQVAMKRWLQAGAFYWIATLSWMPAIVKNGGPWPLVILGWFALAAYCTLYFAAYGYLTANFWGWAREGGYKRRLLGVLIVEPLLWCGLELVRSRFLGGFAWNQLGVVPANAGFGAPAALGGVYLLSAVVILINGTIAGIFERMWRPERSGFAALRKFGSIETVLALLLVFGIYELSSFRFPSNATASHHPPVLRVAMIQRNFPCVFKEKAADPCDVYERLLENVVGLKPDLVVLPESAMCEFGPVDSPRAVAFAKAVARQTGLVLAGGTRHGDGVTYNSAALYNGDNIQIYDKVHLVPFGEFIPGDKWFPALQKLAPVGSCTPGEPRLLYHAKGPTPFGVAICFEDTDSALMRRYAKMGARFLCFITNDSWFSLSNETIAHAWQATARAIETGLPVVRVGNSGVTGTISPEGKASWLLGPNARPLVDQEGSMFDRIFLSTAGRVTPYVFWGDLPLALSFALLICAMILVKYKHHYGKFRSMPL